MSLAGDVLRRMGVSEGTKFQKGDKITLKDGEVVTIGTEFDAGKSGIKFITLYREVGAPYTVTLSKLKKMMKK